MSATQSYIRVTGPVLAGTAVGSIALYFLLSWQPNREARHGFDVKTESLSRMLAQTVRSAVEFDDAVSAPKDLETIKGEKSVRYAAIKRPDGKVFAQTERDVVPTVPDLLQSRENAITEDGVHHVAVPLEAGGKAIGWVQVGFSEDEVRESIAGTRATSLAMAVATGLLGLALSLWLGRQSANRMSLMEQIGSTAGKLRGASENILGSCNEQAAGTTEQAAAINETRQTMVSLVEAARRISEASQQVFKNADHTSQTSSDISEAIKQLTTRAQKISDISEVIRSISDKSDLLALNASLEGTKAGEAGRGFALVAAEMRRLAESVMQAAREIKQLAANIREASDSSVKAADEGRNLAGRTSDSAREITLVTDQQRNATEQVTRSMDEVSQLLQRSAESTKQTERAAAALNELADQLSRLTASFAREQRG
ncbi:MAG: hypothetical protein IPJ65_35890 [Archangiaceae bacterium]|nr:hypothetical protein [Archangiaceae bacterium]